MICVKLEQRPGVAEQRGGAARTVAMPQNPAFALSVIPLLLLAACHEPDEQRGPRHVAEQRADGAGKGPLARSSPTSAVTGQEARVAGRGGAADPSPRSCAAERGADSVNRLVQACLRVSPATRPPCNAANSCAMIEDEIARSCALLGDDAGHVEACRVRAGSRQAALDVIGRYYAALDARDFGTAWAQWGADGRPGQSFEEFRTGFGNTQSTRVTVGPPGDVEGAAGSLYVNVPVTVDATLSSGQRQRFKGYYVLRRVNDIDGASPEQLRWHIDNAQLQSVPVE